MKNYQDNCWKNKIQEKIKKIIEKHDIIERISIKEETELVKLMETKILEEERNSCRKEK